MSVSQQRVMLSEAKHLYDTHGFSFAQRFAARSFATLRMTRFLAR